MGRTIVGAVYRRGLGVWRTATTSIRSHWRAEIQTASGWAPHWSTAALCGLLCCALENRPRQSMCRVVSGGSCSMFRRLGLTFLAHGWQAGGPRTPFRSRPGWAALAGFWKTQSRQMLCNRSHPITARPRIVPDRPRPFVGLALGQHVGTTNACALFSSQSARFCGKSP